LILVLALVVAGAGVFASTAGAKKKKPPPPKPTSGGVLIRRSCGGLLGLSFFPGAVSVNSPGVYATDSDYYTTCLFLPPPPAADGSEPTGGGGDTLHVFDKATYQRIRNLLSVFPWPPGTPKNVIHGLGTRAYAGYDGATGYGEVQVYNDVFTVTTGGSVLEALEAAAAELCIGCG